MKSKVTKILQLLMLLTAGFAACSAIYFLVDNVFDGAFINWFEEVFITTEGHFNPVEGTGEIWHNINWGRLKPALLGLFIGWTLFWLAAVFWAGSRSRHAAQRQVEKIQLELISKEQELKAETTRKNDLIAYLAHDLKTPLTSVIGYLSLLDEAPDMPVEQRAKYTRITLDKAYRLEKMINEFFDITRYNLQQIAIQKEPVDLCYLLVQLTDELLPVLKKNGNTVSLRASETLTVPGDPDKLARVFGNVLKNAAAYSYPGTEIVINAKRQGDSIVIRFTNQGKTIPQDKLDAIFEKFYRLDEARTSSTGGAGLGLAIAKEIVTLHGGSITAESREEAVTFTVTLPAH